jgi:hypothetical protein
MSVAECDGFGAEISGQARVRFSHQQAKAFRVNAGLRTDAAGAMALHNDK